MNHTTTLSDQSSNVYQPPTPLAPLFSGTQVVASDNTTHVSTFCLDLTFSVVQWCDAKTLGRLMQVNRFSHWILSTDHASGNYLRKCLYERHCEIVDPETPLGSLQMAQLLGNFNSETYPDVNRMLSQLKRTLSTRSARRPRQYANNARNLLLECKKLSLTAAAWLTHRIAVLLETTTYNVNGYNGLLAVLCKLTEVGHPSIRQYILHFALRYAVYPNRKEETNQVWHRTLEHISNLSIGTLPDFLGTLYEMYLYIKIILISCNELPCEDALFRILINIAKQSPHLLNPIQRNISLIASGHWHVTLPVPEQRYLRLTTLATVLQQKGNPKII